jgi:hypothetical protein
MDDDEKKKAVAFAVNFLKNFDVMKDIRDNTWPALVHGAFSKAAQIEGMSVSAFIKREQAMQPHKEMVSALMGPGPHNYNPERELDLDTYERLCAALAYTLRNGKKLNPWEEQFVADALENKGTGKRPKGKSGPDKRKNQLRDYTLWRCAEEVAKRYGLGRYSKGSLTKITASEIIAEAAGYSVDIVIEAFRKFNSLTNVSAK